MKPDLTDDEIVALKDLLISPPAPSTKSAAISAAPVIAMQQQVRPRSATGHRPAA
jgi:hypothetical protein